MTLQACRAPGQWRRVVVSFFRPYFAAKWSSVGSSSLRWSAGQWAVRHSHLHGCTLTPRVSSSKTQKTSQLWQHNGTRNVKHTNMPSYCLLQSAGLQTAGNPLQASWTSVSQWACRPASLWRRTSSWRPESAKWLTSPGAHLKRAHRLLRDITPHLADEVHRICSSFKTPAYFSHDSIIRDRFQADAGLVSVQRERNSSSRHVWRKTVMSDRSC